MRKVKVLGAAFFAVLALGAVYASSATAVEEGQWLNNGAAITVAQSAVSTGTWLLLALSLFGFVKTHIICSDELIGTVGPGSTDKVTKVVDLNSNSPLHCEVLKAELGGCPGSELAFLTAENLPWKTLLLKKLNEAKEWEFIDHFKSSGAGNPAFKMQCTLSGGALSEELCEAEEILTDPMTNRSGGVVFWELLNELSTKCEKSGTVSHIYAQGLVKLLNGNTLTVSPGTKVVEEGQWLNNGNAITVAQSAVSTGTWLLLALSLFGFVKTHIVCSDKLLGTVGSGAEDEVTSVVDLNGNTPLHCEVLKAELGGCPGSELVFWTAENLPWETLLLKKLNEAKEWEFIDHFKSSGAGNPAFKIQCTLSGGALSEELCEAEEILTDPLTNQSASGGVFGQILDELSTKCEKSGTTSHVYAQGVVKLLVGGPLTVSP